MFFLYFGHVLTMHFPNTKSIFKLNTQNRHDQARRRQKPGKPHLKTDIIDNKKVYLIP